MTAIALFFLASAVFVLCALPASYMTAALALIFMGAGALATYGIVLDARKRR